MYQTKSYSVAVKGGGYVVINAHGKIVSVGDMTYTHACQLADLYQGDDDADAQQERACADLDGP